MNSRIKTILSITTIILLMGIAGEMDYQDRFETPKTKTGTY